MKEIYFDNSATTKPSGAVIAKMSEAFESWGNPSSMHSKGLSAEKLVNEARGNILAALSVSAREASSLIFCGSGTEANNLALFGTAHAKARNRGGRIIVTNSEHPSVLEPAKRLAEEGFDVKYLSTSGGKIDIGEFASLMTKDTFLVSVMTVNNETGALYDIKSIFAAAKKVNPGVVTHTDFVQGFGKIKTSPITLGADLVTVSAHKINGPKGIGALYASKEVLRASKLVPYICGGGQENGMRSGTENVIGICGFGEAAKQRIDSEKISDIREYIINNIPEGTKANIPEKSFAPHIISITLSNIKSETMLHYLSSKGIFVSSGSACSSHHGGVSHVLTAFGLEKREADTTIRVSLGSENTVEEAREFVKALDEGMKNLAVMK